MLTEIKTILYGILKWLAVVFCLGAYFFAGNLKEGRVLGLKIFYPWLSDRSFVVDFLQMMKADLIPSGVSLIVTGPFDAFLIEMKIAFFLAFIFSSPVIIYALLRYLSPALKAGEKKAIYRVVLPSVALFFAGCIFSYILVIPRTISLLYSYTYSIGAEALYRIDDFVSLTFTLMAVSGLMFLLPVFMFLSSRFGFISHGFWKKYIRHAIFSVLLLMAVITPDGTGITMIIMAVPLVLLYLFGIWLTARFDYPNHSYI